MFSLSTPVSFTKKTDRHDITEILLKVALNTINQARSYFVRVIKSPKQSLGDLLFLLRFLLLFLFLLLLFFFSFLSADHELVHGRSQALLDRIPWNLVEL